MRGKKSSSTSTRKSQSSRAGLIFPVNRMYRKLKKSPQAPKRVGKGASVYITSVIEYLIGKFKSQMVFLQNFKL